MSSQTATHSWFPPKVQSFSGCFSFGRGPIRLRAGVRVSGPDMVVVGLKRVKKPTQEHAHCTRMRAAFMSSIILAQLHVSFVDLLNYNHY